MRIRHSAAPMLILAVLLAAMPAFGGNGGTLERNGEHYEIFLELGGLGVVELKRAYEGSVSVSVEVPWGVGAEAVKAVYGPPTSREYSHRLLERKSLHRYPPSADNAKRWFTFTLPEQPTAGKLRLEITSRAPFSFARVIIGDPFSNRAIQIGAFSAEANALPKDISACEDEIVCPGDSMLGTKSAVQRVRFPAGFLGEDTRAFDRMVPFKEDAFFPDDNNIDTVMVRLDAVPIGGTTRVKLTQFRNQSGVITVHRDGGGKPYYFRIKVAESPHVASEGYLTVLANGDYQSTMRLAPVFTFIPTDKNGNRLENGTDLILDTGLEDFPGFPFWLASMGGRWTNVRPEEQLEVVGTGNFFYTGEAQKFQHSNGPDGEDIGDPTVAECLKTTARAAE